MLRAIIGSVFGGAAIGPMPIVKIASFGPIHALRTRGRNLREADDVMNIRIDPQDRAGGNEAGFTWWGWITS